MIRIGIVGTNSAGKTTLTQAMGRRIRGAHKITEDVRRYVRDIIGKRRIQDLTPEEFAVLEHILYKDQTVGARLSDVAIIDSTPIGCPVYLAHYGLLSGTGYRFNQDIIDGWVNKTQDTLRDYDVIVYLPPEIPYEADGFRTGPEFREPIDAGFIEGHPRVIEVTGYTKGNVAAGVQKRVDAVLQYCLRKGIIDPTAIYG
jgi:nicotinamide riboside kinase